MTSTQNVDLSQPDWTNSTLALQGRRRKRASKACLGCRIRKVRCDLVLNGVPCTNCRVDSQQCVVPKRSRKHQLPSNATLHTVELPNQPSSHPIPATDESSTQPSHSYSIKDHAQPQTSEQSLRPTLGGIFPYQLSDVTRAQPLLEHSITDTSSQSLARNSVSLSADDSRNDTSHFSVDQTGQPISFNATIQPRSNDQGPHLLQHSQPSSLPTTTGLKATELPFLDTTSISGLLPRDFDYLNQIGCFHLPPQSALDELVQAYFSYLHPYLPLIDEGQFWDAYLNHQSPANNDLPMSLLVFQAILLVACPLVATPTIQVAGFRSVREARTVYYHRAKALYDFGFEASNIAKSRAALLLTFHVPLSEPQMNTYWLGIAIHLAKVEDANRYATCVPKASTRYNRLKRLWWCCIIRDRTMALGLRRPISISSSFSDELWPQPTIEDFEGEIARSYVYSAPVKMKLLQHFILLCKLCAVLTDVLQLLYPPHAVLDLSDRLGLLRRVYSHTDDLNLWHDTMTNNTGTIDRHDKQLNTITLFASILETYFHSAKAALCNFRIMLTINEPSQQMFDRLQAKNELQAALRGISQSLRAILNAGMISYSPIGIVAFLIFPSLCYNLDLSTSTSSHTVCHVHDETNIYQNFLKVLQSRYEGTDRALDNMSKLLTEMNLKDATSPSTAPSESDTSPASQGTSIPPPTHRDVIKPGRGLDIIVSNPRRYIQMTCTLDFFLSHGRFPSKVDLPSYLFSPADNTETLSNLSRSQELSTSDATSTTNLERKSAEKNFTPAFNGSIPTRRIERHDPELDTMLTNDPLNSASVNPHDFSFEDFMVDGPQTGIEQLQNMLHRYPDWL